MIRLSAREIIADVALLVAILVPAGSWADTGSAVSEPVNVDTRPPVVTVDDLPPNTLLQTDETITFSWALNDDNPDSAAAANVAEIWLGELLFASHPFSPGTGQHVWQWTVPDTTASTVHIVVNSADTFGNTTTASSNNFTILSATTDAPPGANLPLFAPPAPNPFNPLTQLYFNLPEAGQVNLTVYDTRGYRIKTLLRGYQAAGPLKSQWDGTDPAGRRQSGGTYFFRLVYRAGGYDTQVTRKVVLLP